jgi:hypothetical protein
VWRHSHVQALDVVLLVLRGEVLGHESAPIHFLPGFLQASSTSTTSYTLRCNSLISSSLVFAASTRSSSSTYSSGDTSATPTTWDPPTSAPLYNPSSNDRKSLEEKLSNNRTYPADHSCQNCPTHTHTKNTLRGSTVAYARP